jgi:hypothetical protein
MERNKLTAEEIVTGGDAFRHGDSEQSSVCDQGVHSPDTTGQPSLVDLEPPGGYAGQTGE